MTKFLKMFAVKEGDIKFDRECWGLSGVNIILNLASLPLLLSVRRVFTDYKLVRNITCFC